MVSELLIDLVPGETVLLVLLALVSPFAHTSPVMVTQISEAPLPPATPLLTDAFATLDGHNLPSHLLSWSVNSY